MKKILVLSLVLNNVLGSLLDCTPGKITGISCPSSREIMKEFRPTINTLKVKISTVYKTTGDTTGSTRLLIKNNILSAKNLTNHKFIKMRASLNEAKLEAARASPRVKACIAAQNVEFAKIQHKNFLRCNGNFSSLMELRRQVFKLEEVALELVPFCTRLNPLATEMATLKVCLDGKIKDLELQLLLLEQKFAEKVKEVVNLSTDCVMRESGDVHSKIGAIEGAVRNCRNVGRF